MAWLETARRVYVNQVVRARFRFGSGGYCSAGIMFRVMESGTYYLALVSNKGYFRLDAVNSGAPSTLVGWTEAPGGGAAIPDKTDLGIIARGCRLIFTLNGKWVAEADDASIPGGHLGFVLAAYDEAETEADGDYVCRAWLEYLSVDSGPGTVEREYGKWSDGAAISAESRICLAETFVALNRFDLAYGQVLKIWGQREKAVRSIAATYADMRTGRELLLAARMALFLGLHEEAEGYVNACLLAGADGGLDGIDETEVLAEKAKVLNALGKFDELAEFLPGCIQRLESGPGSAGTVLPSLYAMLNPGLPPSGIVAEAEVKAKTTGIAEPPGKAAKPAKGAAGESKVKKTAAKAGAKTKKAAAAKLPAKAAAAGKTVKAGKTAKADAKKEPAKTKTAPRKPGVKSGEKPAAKPGRRVKPPAKKPDQG